MKCTPQKTMNSASGCWLTWRGELERVAGVVGELDHLVALVVVAEDDEAAAERRPGGGDARVHLLVGQTEIALRQRLALADVLFLVGGQERNHAFSFANTYWLVKLFASPL